MDILVKLPHDRTQEGQIFLNDVLLGRCRGKADGQMAVQKGNPARDPRKAFGDHPDGASRVFEVRDCTPDMAHSYGPHKLCLMAVDGDAKIRQDSETEWDGLEAHGGDLATDGVTLRATYGCLRLPNALLKVLASAVKQAMARGEEVMYRCASV